MNCRAIGIGLLGVWMGLWAVQTVEARNYPRGEHHETDEKEESEEEKHPRDYLVSQPYGTTEKGEFEVALWNDMNFANLDEGDTYNSRHQIELEYGVTDHLQLAYYEVYTWDRTKDWERDEFKVEGKLRLAEAGEWPLDIALYTEYQNPDGPHGKNSDAFENKVILSKGIGPWGFIGNFVFEKKINTSSDWEYEYTAGVSYGMTPRTRLGLEIKQGLGDAGDFGFSRDHKLFLVPGIYTSLTPNVRLLVGPAIGLTKASDDLQIKSILEVEF